MKERFRQVLTLAWARMNDFDQVLALQPYVKADE
jgi:hypothetical protein